MTQSFFTWKGHGCITLMLLRWRHITVKNQNISACVHSQINSVHTEPYSKKMVSHLIISGYYSDWVRPFTVKENLTVDSAHARYMFFPLRLQYCYCEDRFSVRKYGSVHADLICMQFLTVICLRMCLFLKGALSQITILCSATRRGWLWGVSEVNILHSMPFRRRGWAPGRLVS